MKTSHVLFLVGGALLLYELASRRNAGLTGMVASPQTSIVTGDGGMPYGATSGVLGIEGKDMADTKGLTTAPDAPSAGLGTRRVTIMPVIFGGANSHPLNFA